MPYVKTSTIANLRSTFLKIKDKTSLSQTIALVNSKKPDYLLLEKPIPHQMAAALLLRLAGKKFIFTVHFQNPPQPSFFSKLLLAQADKIVTTSTRNLNKLKSWGISKAKIHIQR